MGLLGHGVVRFVLVVVAARWFTENMDLISVTAGLVHCWAGSL